MHDRTFDSLHTMADGLIPSLLQARDKWVNNLRKSSFNVTVGMFPANDTIVTGATTRTGESTLEFYSVSFLRNGSGIAAVAYKPTKAGKSFLHGEVANDR